MTELQTGSVRLTVSLNHSGHHALCRVETLSRDANARLAVVDREQDGVGVATVITIGIRCPQIPRAARACAGGDSAGAATTPIRAAAHGEPSVHAFSGRYAL